MGFIDFFRLGSLKLQFLKRDRATIIADIIESVKYCPMGKRKTHIMRNANLNFEQINKYLDLLIRNGYLVFDGQVYKPTASGLQFMETVLSDYTKLRVKV